MAIRANSDERAASVTETLVTNVTYSVEKSLPRLKYRGGNRDNAASDLRHARHIDTSRERNPGIKDRFSANFPFI